MKNNLKVHRAIHDLTQEDLAQKVGVSRQTINAIEKGKYSPSLLVALKIARVVEVNVEAIFTIDKNE